jgi:hypothetical protein
MQQAESFTGVVAIARGLERPVLVMQISDRVTDGGSHVQEVLVGMMAHGVGYELVKDWQLLLLLNELSSTDCAGFLPNPQLAVDWIQDAKVSLNKYLPELDLPFAVPNIRDLILLWPQVIT